MTPVIVVAGPTASGKTALAIEVAERLQTEIISADSMQFYRGMEIGTGAPSPEEQARVPHHFVGFLEPDQSFSAGEFERLGRKIIRQLSDSSRPTVVVGGSGLYISALIDGLFPGPGKDEHIRKRLREEARTAGIEVLFERLQEVDPGYAALINKGDLRRIVRGLEVFELTGSPLSELHREHQEGNTPLPSIQFAIDWPREELYDRINRRVDHMLAVGLLDEVQALVNNGYGPQIDRLRSLGYREMAAYLRGETAIEDATELMKMNTRRYAKRQLSWFRGDERIAWLPAHAERPLCDQILDRYSAEAESV